MLTFAGTPVVMANASQALRAHADPRWHWTRSNDEDGLAEAIRALVFQNSDKRSSGVP
jgi:hydroxymethylpyrimidine pyrophosphatase-like HAD family hydrolase